LILELEQLKLNRMRNPTYRRALDLLEAEISDELVALDPSQGECFGFNSVATAVWQQLKEPRSLDQLKAHLLAEYDIDEGTCETELRELLDELEEKGLIALLDSR
jgi:hypothetical protein